jgi:hypothetical protein
MEKVDYKHGKFTLATTECDVKDFCREDYEEYCEVNGMEPGDEDDFSDWCREETDMNFEQDLDNIETCKEYNVPVLITGHLGLWWGKPEIDAVRMESVIDAVHKCLNSADYGALIEWEDGEIHVYSYHHDGCNSFTIKALSKKGQARQSGEYKEGDTKRLPYLYAIGI